MSNPSDYPGASGPFVDIGDLRDAGVPVSDEVDAPEVGGSYVLDDNDSQTCRYATADEIRPMYIDNPTSVGDVQPEVWNLSVENEPITFTYANGRRYTVRIGDIDVDHGQAATRYYKSGDLVYPTDDSQRVLLNATATPRLSALHRWMLDQMRERNDERLEMAELVNAFAEIIGSYSDALDR